MKLAELDTLNTTDINIKLPNGDKTDIVITCYTPDSLEWDKIESKMMRYLSNKEAVLIDKESGDTKFYIDPTKTKQNHEKLLTKLSRMVVSIKGIDEFEDNKINSDDVKELLFKKHPWLFEQVDKHLGKRENWFKLKNKE
jgi:ribosomal protein L20A (L18A)